MKINFKDLIAYFIFAIILFPVIFSIVGTDSAIYLQAGKTILNGERIYVDFVDIKTPLFFTFYAFINFIIQDNPDYLHILLFLIFFLSALFLFHFIKKLFNYKIALFTSIIYSLTTLTIGHTLNYHAELMFNFLLLAIIILTLKMYYPIYSKSKSQNLTNDLILGIFLGLYISIKYTFALILLPILFLGFFNRKDPVSNFYHSNLLILPVLFLTIIISHFWLFDPQIFQGFWNTLKVLQGYANQPPISDKLVRDIVKITGQLFGDYFTLLFTFSAFIGFLSIFDKEWEAEQRFLLILSFLLLGALLLSVYIERKLIIYHFGRLIIPYSILSGIGIVLLIEKFSTIWKNTDNKFLVRTSIIIFSIFVITVGPLARYIGIMRFPIIALRGKENYYQFIDEQRPNFFNYTEKLKLINFINSNYNKNYKTIIISIGSFDLIYGLNTNVYKKLPQRNTFLPKTNNNPFYYEFLRLLQESELIIIQKNDGIFENLTGNKKTSYELVTEDKEVISLLREKYKIVYETSVYVVFEKIK